MIVLNIRNESAKLRFIQMACEVFSVRLSSLVDRVL